MPYARLSVFDEAPEFCSANRKVGNACSRFLCIQESLKFEECIQVSENLDAPKIFPTIFSSCLWWMSWRSENSGCLGNMPRIVITALLPYGSIRCNSDRSWHRCQTNLCSSIGWVP